MTKSIVQEGRCHQCRKRMDTSEKHLPGMNLLVLNSMARAVRGGIQKQIFRGESIEIDRYERCARRHKRYVREHIKM